MKYPPRVKLVDVSPRDGLQNFARNIPTTIKLQLIASLVKAGLRDIEATAFVSPHWVPQMADAPGIMAELQPQTDIRYPVLVPNLQGFDRALEAGAREIAIFTAASETFSLKNTNASILESLQRLAPVTAAAQALDIPVRGYISCVVGCPFEGPVSPDRVAGIAAQLLSMGCHEISLGDTIGIGTPGSIVPMVEACARQIPMERLAGHYHDTRGMAIANIHASLQLGMAVFDGAVAGLGGCPYAPGAAGNVASEDVVFLMNGLGVETGIDLTALVEAGNFISTYLGRNNASRAALAQSAGTTP